MGIQAQDTSQRRDGQGDRAETARLLHLATYASVATASLLICAKLVAWLLTGSVTVLASLIDSTMDAGASLINLLAVRWSLLPPDAEHRFGHGKAESLAALGQATFIAGSAGLLLLQALDRLWHPRAVEEIGVGVGVISFAILLTLGLLLIQHHVIRRTGSQAIRADALHYATDLATNTAALVALLLTGLGWPGSDPLFGLGIGVYILYSAARIGRDAVQMLMDHELPEPQRRHITELALGVPRVRGVHDLRTRQSGQSVFIQFHVEVDGALPLRVAHDVAQDAEAAIRQHYPHSDIIVHQDPVDV